MGERWFQLPFTRRWSPWIAATRQKQPFRFRCTEHWRQGIGLPRYSDSQYPKISWHLSHLTRLRCTQLKAPPHVNVSSSGFTVRQQTVFQTIRFFVKWPQLDKLDNLFFGNYFNLVDPPQDVGADITVLSPSSASLVFLYRPPGSRSHLIKSFSLKLSNAGEPITVRVVRDEVCWRLFKNLILSRTPV